MAQVDLPSDEERRVPTFEEVQINFIDEVLKLFKTANYVVLIVVGVLVVIDEANIYFFGWKASDRIISSNIIISLIGATTIQVGTIAITIANYLFKGGRSKSEP
jgi:hypothetical protein